MDFKYVLSKKQNLSYQMQKIPKFPMRMSGLASDLYFHKKVGALHLNKHNGEQLS
jgi:hypothetical protein